MHLLPMVIGDVGGALEPCWAQWRSSGVVLGPEIEPSSLTRPWGAIVVAQSRSHYEPGEKEWGRRDYLVNLTGSHFFVYSF